MSWIQKLYETYENCQANIGYSETEGQRPLLPICHSTTQAHIEIVIDGNGNFRRAKVITDKSDVTTIIPCTESSAGRAGSKPVNHPLCDKLQYLAGDFSVYDGSVTSGFAKDPEEPFRNYTEDLSKWCRSEFGHPKARAILSYVNKRAVIEDLVNHQILFVGQQNQLLDKKEVEREKNATDIFSVMNSQDSAFVRWIVESDDTVESKVWKDRSLWESWIGYCLSSQQAESICFVTGNDAILTTNHPKFIRREGDGAKLISANDTTNFTYRGRFGNAEQACGVSLDVSHKAHFALSWLISRQGYRKGDLAIVAWATSGTPVPQPTDDEVDILGFDNLVSDEAKPANTAQGVARKLTKSIAGYGKEIGDTTDVVVMGVDSATPGRLSITFYRELTGSEFLERLISWHETCTWLHSYRFADKKRIWFTGAPAPHDIAEDAYGKRVDDKLRKATIERLLPCILDGQPIPRDLVESAVRRASNRIGIRDNDDKFEREWNKTLSIACALFNKFNRKESYTMALDPDRTTRDYLYGRLLALADSLEGWALNEASEKRETNAARLMQRFAEHPYSTWRTLELALTPYKARLGGKSAKRQQMIDEVVASFEFEDFLDDRRLSGEFLLGYHSQREFLRNNRSQAEGAEIPDVDDSATNDSEAIDQ
jgi:CRISPR-associated protein Csd1